MNMIFRNPLEIDLLLCCARIRLSQEIVERIHTLIQEGPDWTYLIQTAIQHRVMSLLYRTLKKTCPEKVPDDVLKRLQNYFLINASKNLFLSTELLKIDTLFEDHGILAIPFKGPTLAESVYGDISLRSFWDLDILVHRHNALKALNLLISQGYRPQVELDINQIRAYLRTEYDIAMISDSGKVLIELHWEMTGKFLAYSLDLESLEDRIQLGELVGRQIRQLSPEDLFAYLCIHGAKDCWNKLENVCSIAELIRSRPNMDWTEVNRLVRKMRCQRIVFSGLILAHDLLDAPLPKHILSGINADLAIKKIVAQIYDGLFPPRDKSHQKMISHDFSLFHIKVRDSFSEKISYCAALIFRPSRQEWRYYPLPASFAFLHYFLRPVRLAWGLMVIFLRRIASG